MGAKKLHNLFSPAQKKEKKTTSLAVKQTKENKEQSIKDKREIESYVEAIRGKLQDPEMAKKAAQILEEMLKSSK